MSMVYMHIDDEELDRVQQMFSDLSPKVVRLAYHRALKRTEATIRQQAVRALARRLNLKPGGVTALKKRVQAHLKVSSSADEMKFWFGLNDFNPYLFRGGIRRAKGGLMIRGTYHERAFVGVVYGKRLVWQRVGKSRWPVKKLMIPVSDDMMTALEDEVFENIPLIFLRHFETDLRGRASSQAWKKGWTDRTLSAAARNIAG